MSWIDNSEKIKIKKLADNLKEKQQAITHPGGVVNPMLYYDFESPDELDQSLTKMWKELDKPMLNCFSKVIIVAAFKNKNIFEEIEVSPFNYEF